MSRTKKKDTDDYIFRKEVPWKERRELIFERYPRSRDLDFNTIFDEDPAICGRIINDMIRLESTQSRPGKRPAVDPVIAAERFRRMWGDDYSEKPFAGAFADLKGDMSLRTAARKVSIDKMTLSAFLNEKRRADVADMELIAEGFKKHPSYFTEWRMIYVLSFLSAIMEKHPEMLTVQYEKLRGQSINGRS